jgi:hypothetical protein
VRTDAITLGPFWKGMVSGPTMVADFRDPCAKRRRRRFTELQTYGFPTVS